MTMLWGRLLFWSLALAAIYLLICAVMFVLQRQLLYHPDTRAIALDVAALPSAVVQTLSTADGEQLQSWWVAPANPAAPVYLYLPGNAQTLANRAERLRFLVGEGAGLLAVSWRGYGGSSGSPSAQGLRLDAGAAYDWLSARVAPSRIILFGESLGTGLAVELAADRQSAALILDSAYGSIAAVASAQYPWLPVNLLLRERFDSLALAPRVRVPVRLLHCQRDPLVPYAQGQALFAALASTDKLLVTVPQRCHVPTIAPLASTLRALEQAVQAAHSETR